MTSLKYFLFAFFLITGQTILAQTLIVKDGKRAIIKKQPTGDGEIITRIPEGTEVLKLNDLDRYYFVQLKDGRTGYSYKGNYLVSDGNASDFPDNNLDPKERLMIRDDVLKIIVIDVEVGDATLIICPEENGKKDVILIDTGENDADRIKEELIANGFVLANTPITRFYVSHYDHDHMGDAKEITPLAKTTYDLGGSMNYYEDGTVILDRRTMTLNYEESFSGGVTVECIATNNATDFDPTRTPHRDKNTNSMALIISYNDFEYFTAGDLTLSPERSLATGVRNCDVYHANHHGSSTTSSQIDFVTRLDPEVTIASNGHKYGHPRDVVAQRLIDLGSVFCQTNINLHDKAHHPQDKYLGDNTYNSKKKDEDAEGATGSIRVIVDDDKYYLIMPRLPLSEGTFSIEH